MPKPQVFIRNARPGDEEQLAHVHIQSWQEAYQGLVPNNPNIPWPRMLQRLGNTTFFKKSHFLNLG